MQKDELPIFETERLRAHRWRVDLAEQALEIYSDSHVTRHISKMHCQTLQEMIAKLEWAVERNTQWDEPFGSFPVFSKSSDQLVGTALIKNLPDQAGNLTDDIEIGWHLGRRYWGQGFATEFGNELIRIGFDQGLSVVYAVTDLENSASQAVCKRLGMKNLGQSEKYYGQRLELFEIRQ
ncbi:GNAT family N-acetyltransferase [bacterium]|nr:GNAT family N-acetyltransferase [bacterium]